MPKLHERIRALKESIYHQAVDLFAPQKDPLGAAKFLRSSEKLYEPMAKTAAQMAGTLPSIILHEHLERARVMAVQPSNEVRAWNIRLLTSLLERDEAKALIYEHMTGGDELVPSEKAVVIVSAYTKKPVQWVREVYAEMERDPILNNSRLQLPNRSQGRLRQIKTVGQSKKELFEMLDQAHEKTGVFREDGALKAPKVIAREIGMNLAGRFSVLRHSANWRVWEDAVAEWQKSREKKKA